MNDLVSAKFGSHLSYESGEISLSEVISAMTFALDLTEGAVPGHSLRSCLLGMKLARVIGLADEQCAHLYYALQLKDIGCSNNAARMHQIVGGDDRELKAAAKLADWTKPHRVQVRTIRTVWRNAAPDRDLPHRIARMLKLGFTQHANNREMIELRCERGAEILRRMEMGAVAANAVKRLDEHWDGSGYPEGLRGEEIPLLARICSVAQNLDVFNSEDGPAAAIAVMRQRSGTWFDPALVHRVMQLEAAGELWTGCEPSVDVEETRRAVLDLDPRMQAALTPERVDNLCEAFASVVDAKSPFTYRHSVGVADIAEEIALTLGLAPERTLLVRRAGLLHDIGKLRVPNSILDKPGKLTKDEWAIMREHPALSRSILQRVRSFRELAALSGEHHEKLDGSGYPLGLLGESMSLESRVLALADNFAALAEDRPYRAGLSLEQIQEILSREVPHKLDGLCYEALLGAAARWEGTRPAPKSAEPHRLPIAACWLPSNSGVLKQA